MEWTKASNIPSLVEKQFLHQRIEITYTQWEDEDLDADESITTFLGYLRGSQLSENKQHGLDIRFYFQSENGEESIEIMMDFPPDDEDMVAQMLNDETTLQIFGNESTLVMKKG